MADLKDAASEMRASHERYEAEARKREDEAARYRRRSNRVFWMVTGVIYTFGLYVSGPTIVRVLIKATAEWQALFHSFPNP